MWKLPWYNLCFLLVLITTVTLHHSVLVFGPTGRRYAVLGHESAHAAFREPLYALAATGRSATPNGPLAGLWRRAMLIEEWTVEYGTGSWSSGLGSAGARGDLIDARFHVANAEVLGFGLCDNQKAKLELNQATRDLLLARSSLKESLRPTVARIKNELDSVTADLDTIAGDDPDSLEAVKSQLDQLIHAINSARVEPGGGHFS
jgi:hypothetical protein